jgi:hypothetical protein
MKRLLPALVLACALPGLAQDAPKPETPPSDKPAPAAAPAASPVPSGEPAFTGFVDFGYRWVGTGGSFNTYRSVVDLGSGPKLLGTEFQILDPKHRLFDRISVRAYNWGDDPYSTVHVTAQKNKLYDFSADYRNIAYYNNLPAFADPLLPTGVVLNEQSLDTRQRMGSYQLTLRPESWLIPYLAYDRNSSKGSGVANFVSGGDEFPVGSVVTNSTDNYRGGVRIEQPRFHITLEQGGTTFRDDQQLGLASGKDYGNFLGPLLGQTLVLTGLTQNYRVRGDSIYSKGLLTANVASWFDLYGQFLYSQPQSNVYYQQSDTGNQVILSQLLFYTGEQSIVAATSKLPHTSGSLGGEIRPMRRLRILPVWLTDRMHTASSDATAQTLTTASGPAAINSLLSNALVNNYSQAEVNLIYELTRKITVRGGYRYVWGYASDVILPLAELAGLDQGHIRRNVALAGLTFRPSAKLSVNADFEDGSSGQSYYRTSLYNYQKGRVRARYQVTPSFSISANGSVLNNQNPNIGINYDFLSHQESMSFLYSPSGGKYWDIQGGYTRATMRSDINYLDPAYETPQSSFYRDNSHVATALFDANIPLRPGMIAKLSFGGSFYISSGSNPTQFYQPTGKLSVPVNKALAWVTEWRYYGFDENFYGYQGFRTQMVTTGVRLSR